MDRGRIISSSSDSRRIPNLWEWFSGRVSPLSMNAQTEIIAILKRLHNLHSDKYSVNEKREQSAAGKSERPYRTMLVRAARAQASETEAEYTLTQTLRSPDFSVLNSISYISQLQRRRMTLPAMRADSAQLSATYLSFISDSGTLLLHVWRCKVGCSDRSSYQETIAPTGSRRALSADQRPSTTGTNAETRLRWTKTHDTGAWMRGNLANWPATIEFPRFALRESAARVAATWNAAANEATKCRYRANALRCAHIRRDGRER